MLDSEFQQAVVNKLKSLREIASARFQRDIPFPVIYFDCVGTRGGYHKSGTLHFNMVLLRENYEKYIESTVPHEMAHFVQWLVYPYSLERKYGKNRKVHGVEWKSIMNLFGVKPERTHNYDVTNARQRTRKKFPVYCKCSTPKLVTITLIRRLELGKCYRCIICNTKVSKVPLQSIVVNLTTHLTPV